jgi:hypothetical protein
MANAPSINLAARNVACAAVTALVDQGNEAGQLRIYAGLKPINADAGLSGNTLLAQLTMSDPAYGAPVNGQAVAGLIVSDVSADATGTATFFRVGSVNSGAFTPIIQGEVGVTGSDLNLNSTAIAIGGTVAVSSLTYTQAGG